MDVLLLFLLMMAGCYLAPVVMPGWKWLAALAGGGALAGLVLWFGWVEPQTDSISSGIAALFVLCLGAALAFGVAVRSVVLWQHWTGWSAGMATGLGAVLLVAWVLWFFWVS